MCIKINKIGKQEVSWTDGRTDGQTDRGKTVYPPPPSRSGGIIKKNNKLKLVLL